jgi:hypothetical protein
MRQPTILRRFTLTKKENLTNGPETTRSGQHVARLKHLSLSTEQQYRYYIKQFIFFHHKQHPNDMGENEIRAYLSHLATNLNVASSTQSVALTDLLFLYSDVLKEEFLDGSSSSDGVSK